MKQYTNTSPFVKHGSLCIYIPLLSCLLSTHPCLVIVLSTHYCNNMSAGRETIGICEEECSCIVTLLLSLLFVVFVAEPGRVITWWYLQMLKSSRP